MSTLNVDIGKNTTDLIHQLAHQMGVAADKVFPWYVHQSILIGEATPIILFVSFIILALTAVGLIRCSMTSTNEDVTVFAGVGGGIATVAAGIIMLVLLVNAVDWYSMVYNPQYWAMHKIIADLSALKG
jgi:hypothetical protein